MKLIVTKAVCKTVRYNWSRNTLKAIEGSWMDRYDDEVMMKGLYLFFVIFQALMLLIVYAFVYTSFEATRLAVAKYHLTFMAYLPVVLALVGYPVVLFKTRKVFQKKKMLRALVWVISWASVIIVGLYWHLAKITSF